MIKTKQNLLQTRRNRRANKVYLPKPTVITLNNEWSPLQRGIRGWLLHCFHYPGTVS